MNERYKELWGKALDKAVPETYTTLSDDQLNKVAVVFGGLVADECAKICEDLSFTPEGPSHEAKYQRDLCALEIRKVFGVPVKFRKGA